MRTDPFVRALLLAAGCVAGSTGRGDNWPAWRGPLGSGMSHELRVPVHWSTNQNVRWRIPLPERGNSTPIVWGARVFLTQPQGTRRTVMCLSRDDGRLLWQSGPESNEREKTHEENPPCSASPVTDGRRVIAWFGSAGVHAYDPDGRELWRRDLGRPSHQWGYAASPILYRDLCIVHVGPGERSFLVALDQRTGRTVWQRELPHLGADAAWEEVGGRTSEATASSGGQVAEAAGSWATPLVVRGGAREELILPCPLQVLAFAPRTGQCLWTCAGVNIGIYSSPCFGDGLVGISADGFTNIVMAVRPGGSGEVTATHRLWWRSAPDSRACIGSPVIHRGLLFQMTYMGMAQCLDLQTGQLVWEERLTGSGARNASWSSPVLAADRLYFANQNADVFVVPAAPQFTCLATNSIGGERMNASPAISAGAIYLRTHEHLWCVAEGKAR